VNAWKDVLEGKIAAKTARIQVIGLGYVGLSLAVEIAKAGFTVRGVDVDLERVARLNRGESYLSDVATETLAPLVGGGRLVATTEFDEVGEADVLIICVPTPLRKSKEPDISFIVAALESLLPHLRPGQLLVLALYRMYKDQGKSFVPKYLTLLEAGGSDSPEVLLKPLGVNLHKSEFWQKGFVEIKALVANLQKLI